MGKEEIYAYLTAKGISYEVTDHEAVFNMDEIRAVALPYPQWDAKNLFIRDDKKQHYYLISVKGDKRVDLKAFRKAQGLRPLSFASPDDLRAILQLTPGAVTPLGLLNDRERRVHLYVDADFKDHLIGVHPNDNTATVWLSADDLLSLIAAHGNEAEFVDV